MNKTQLDEIKARRHNTPCTTEDARTPSCIEHRSPDSICYGCLAEQDKEALLSLVDKLLPYAEWAGEQWCVYAKANTISAEHSGMVLDGPIEDCGTCIPCRARETMKRMSTEETT